MRNRGTVILIALGGWALMGLLLTLEIYFNTRASMGFADPVDIAITQFGRAAMWVLLVPAVLELRRRVPLSRGCWWGGITFHLGMAFVLMATFYLGRVFSYQWLWEKGAEMPFWKLAFEGFYGRNVIDMLFYWAVLGLGYGLEIRDKYRNEELKAAQLETRLVEAELNALRQQMHPHFLFNTLNTIAVLVREHRDDEAVQLLSQLSALLRMSLDNSGVPEVTLQQELDFLQRYIGIQQARFSDRLQVRIEIAQEALRARIPNLLLQPLVENAILHGVAPKAGPGLVQVLGYVAQDTLYLEVSDDGPGIVNGATRTREGVGLSNTRERLQRIYGSRAQMVLTSEAGKGVSIKLRLPFRV